MYYAPNVPAGIGRVRPDERYGQCDETIATCQANWNASVINPNNYQISNNGTVLSGVITNVQYGLNEAATLGLSAVGTNKYQLVLTFSVNTPGTPPLGSGNYTIKAVVRPADDR